MDRIDNYSFEKYWFGGYKAYSVENYREMVNEYIEELNCSLKDAEDVIEELKAKSSEYESKEKCIADAYIEAKQVVAYAEDQAEKRAFQLNRELEMEIAMKKEEKEREFEERLNQMEMSYQANVNQQEQKISELKLEQASLMQMNDDFRRRFKEDIQAVSEIINIDKTIKDSDQVLNFSMGTLSGHENKITEDSNVFNLDDLIDEKMLG